MDTLYVGDCSIYINKLLLRLGDGILINLKEISIILKHKPISKVMFTAEDKYLIIDNNMFEFTSTEARDDLYDKILEALEEWSC